MHELIRVKGMGLGRDKEVAEKLDFSGEICRKHTSGAEAHADLIGFMPGINPRPTARMSFSSTCKAPNFIPCPSRPRRLFGGGFLLDDLQLDGQLYVVAHHGRGEAGPDSVGGPAEGGGGGEAGV